MPIVKGNLCMPYDKYLDYSRSRIKNSCIENEKGCWIWAGYLCDPKKIYGLTSLVINGKKKKCLAHRASYFLFKGDIPDGKMVLHYCDTPLCCNPRCLHLGDAKLNMDEMRERNRKVPAKGEKNRHAKFKNEDIIKIRELFNKGVKVCDLCKIYNCHSSTMSYICRNITWKHL